MAEPFYSVTTERAYSRLPEFVRRADIRHDYPLKRYLSVVGDVLAEVDLLIARLDYVSPDARTTGPAVTAYSDYTQPGRASDVLPIGATSDLVDPYSGDAAWLSWQAQLFGTNLKNTSTVPEQRGRVAGATVWGAGSRGSVLAAARSVLTGSKTVKVTPNYQGNRWQVLVQSYVFETPDQTLLATVLNSIKPTAVKFVFDVLPGITWEDQDAKNMSWSTAEQYTWEQLGMMP